MIPNPSIGSIRLRIALRLAVIALAVCGGLVTTSALAEQHTLQFRADAGGPYAAAVGDTIRLDGSVRTSDRTSVESLRRIGLALNNYHSTYAGFPPAFSIAPDGAPLLSWRVLVLPFLDDGAGGSYLALYNQFDLDKPWDDPANLPLLSQMPDVYRSGPRPQADVMTGYAGVFGPDAVFKGGPLTPGDPRATRFRDILDGTSNTLLAGQTGRDAQIPWTAPGDIDIELIPVAGDPHGFDGKVRNLTPFLMADGRVEYLDDATDPSDVLALSTIAGGEVIDQTALFYGYTYEWDFDLDWNFETSGQNPQFEVTSAKPRVQRVRIQVTDPRGRQSRAVAKIFVTEP